MCARLGLIRSQFGSGPQPGFYSSLCGARLRIWSVELLEFFQVVPLVGNWFGYGRRGLIMGVWNSHVFIGNILGLLVAGRAIQSVIKN